MGEKIPITVKFYSTLKNTVGTSKITLEIEYGNNILTLLKKVENEYFVPKESHLLKSDNSGLAPGVICLIDDVDLNLWGGLKKNLTKPHVITLISSLHGG